MLLLHGILIQYCMIQFYIIKFTDKYVNYLHECEVQ